MQNPIFQLWTSENNVAQTITTAKYALEMILKSPDGWALEEFDYGLVSRGIIRKNDDAAMIRLRAMVRQEDNQ